MIHSSVNTINKLDINVESHKEQMINQETKQLSTSTDSMATQVIISNRSSKTSDIESASEQPNVEEEVDGGFHGWLVVLGALCVQVASNGLSTFWYDVFENCVMQDYYEQNYFPNVPNITVNLSFVGTLSSIVFYGATPFAQVYTSMVGFRISLMTGTILIALSLEMAGFSTQIWHLYLTFGVVFGLGAACSYVVIMGVTPQWFTKHRGVAFGIITSGSGMGGLVFPFIVNVINEKMGANWAFRVLGFICFGCDMMGCCLIKERQPTPKKKLSQILRWECLKDMNVVLFMMGSNVGLFGYFTPYFFVPSYATYLGLSPSQGTALVAVAAAFNFIGRISTGYLADKIGNMNTNLLCTFITSLSCLLIWTFAFTYGSLMGFSVIFGFFSGSYFALVSPICTQLVGAEKFLSAVSLIRFTNVVPLFGPNIASAIEEHTNAAPFFSYKIFAGMANLMAAVILLVFKFRVNHHFFAKI